MSMKSEITSKKDIYQAGCYALVLVTLSCPLAVFGIRILNFVLGNIQV